VLNALLSVINERVFHNDGAPVRCPLVSLFAASNELPEGKELEALFDRFLLRFDVGYLLVAANLRGVLVGPEPAITATLTMDELRRAQAEAASVKITDDTVDALPAIRDACPGEGITASDRRWKKSPSTEARRRRSGGRPCYPDRVSRPATVGMMTEAEYLEYDRSHDGKYEYLNGEVVAMAGVSDAHDRIQVNITVALANRLRGGPCRVRGADLRVRLDETGLYCYPDLTIVRGEPAFAATRPVTFLNPWVIIEVLSETTEEYDRGTKVAHYRHRASVDLILLIDSQHRMVERQQRNPDGTWTLSEHTTGKVVILEHEVPLDELYDGVALAATP